MPEPLVPATSLLSTQALRAALLERHATARVFEGRDSYVGASEVGSCARLVAWRKLHPDHEVDAEAAGRMRAGQVLENEAVQMIRLALGGAVRGTGAAQVEMRVEDAPLRVHPDGRILREAMVKAMTSGIRIVVLTKDGSKKYLEELPEGDGVLEIKTSSDHGVRALGTNGLSKAYDGQTQTEMGASKLRWGLLVMVSRENLAKAEVVFLEFEPAEFEAMKMRARFIMAAVEKIREGILTEEAGLPQPEEDRGYCSKCPIADTCPAMVLRRAQDGDGATIPPDEVDEFEAMSEEYLELKPAADRFESVKDILRKRADAAGIVKAALPSGTVLALSLRKGRVSYDGKALAAYPEAEAAARKEGAPFAILTVKKGA
ncbi:MAG TPA: hypothetical protein VN436_16655 [Holophaga sp.]|nr:hypothetical protein [Holophaga sp.]